jgi:hypothetical protein
MVRADGTEGRMMPLDAEHTGMAVVRFGAAGGMAKFTKVWKSHFASCPYAKEHRYEGQRSKGAQREIRLKAKGKSDV